jgi:hypothetical protein
LRWLVAWGSFVGMSAPHTSAGSGRALLLVSLLLPAAVLADSAPVESGTSVQLKVGQTKELNVGLAIGLACDNGSIARAELRAVSDTENHLVLTGLKPGQTDCRAGTATVSRSVLVHITVVPKGSDYHPSGH